jgi:hypothetical protein
MYAKDFGRAGSPGDRAGNDDRKAHRTAELASNGLQVTFACCDQTHCNSGDFVYRDRIPHLGVCFTRRRRERAIQLAICRTGSGRENPRSGRLCSWPSRIQRKRPLVIFVALRDVGFDMAKL